MKEYYALTKEQRQIYDLVRVEGEAAASIDAIIRFQREIERKVLEEVTVRLIDGNEVLHARLIREGTEAKQVFDVPTERLYEIKEFQDEEEAEAYAKRIQGEALPADGLLCFFIGYKTKNSCGLIIHMHHIIADAWTVMLLGRQFAGGLEAKGGAEEDQAAAVYSYTDHIQREQREDRQRQYQRDLAYWQEQYAEVGEAYLLGQNRGYQAAEARRVSFALSKRDAERIAEFGRNGGATPAAVFYTLYAACFDRMRIDREERFLMGVPFFNRRGEQEKNTAGIYVNTFAVRADIEEEKSLWNQVKYLGIA